MSNSVRISLLLAEMHRAGIRGLQGYEQRLRANAGSPEVFTDLLFEADTALMFAHHGLSVTMREKPDLQIELAGETAYVEVKHFREKKQDRIDEQATRDSEDLVPVGILTPTEGAEAWEQIADVAVRKADQYMPDASNILVITTSSNAVHGGVLSTAVCIYDQRATKNQDLHRLNGLMLVDQWIVLGTDIIRNVYFGQVACALVPLGDGLRRALEGIHYWVTPRSVASIGYR